MKEKVIFLNTAWMKYYEGKNEDDKPVNGGSYIKDYKTGGEVYNFQDYNGKCYGYFMHSGNNALEKHFSDVRSTDSFVDDVLVIWVATNLKKETRIVGWYKNAKLFREMQHQIAFTISDYNLYYSILANAEDCYLIPEENRSFPIERASQAGTGMGMGQSNIWYAESDFARSILIPQVIDYIEKYDGPYANFIFDEEITEIRLDEEEMIDDFDKLYEMALEAYNRGDYYFALKCLNSAKEKKETPELLYYIGSSLFYLKRFDNAISAYEKLLNQEDHRKQILFGIMFCYDLKGDRGKTIEYAYELLLMEEDSIEDVDGKIGIYYIIFDIYINNGDLGNAKKVCDELSSKINTENSRLAVSEFRNCLKRLSV